MSNRKIFKRQWKAFRTQALETSERFSLTSSDLFPIYGEATSTTDFDRHYVYHTAWAARVIASIRPAMHVDISSSLYFSAIVSAFCPVQLYDYRPPELTLSNLKTHSGNLSRLPFEDEAIDCISCMHVIEHIGLGRYGDPIDYDGDLRAIRELCRVVKPKGNLLFVVPVGKPRVQFNAHRIYSFEQIMSQFTDFELKEFCLIPDSAETGGLVINATPALVAAQQYGCGCFWLQKQ